MWYPPVVIADELIRLRVVDAKTQQEIPARVYLTNEAGEAFYFSAADVSGKPQGAVRYDKQNWINKASIERHTTITTYPAEAKLPPGDYTLVVERGKTYFPVSQSLTVRSAAKSTPDDNARDITVPLTQWFDAAAANWYSGDTHIHRPISELQNVVLAEDLNVAFPLSFWVTKSDLAPSDSELAGDQLLAPELLQVTRQHVIWPRNTEYEIFTTANQNHTLGALFVLGHKQVLEKRVPPWGELAKELSSAEPDVFYDMDKLDWPFAMVLPPQVPGALYELTNNHLWRTKFGFNQWNSAAPSFMQPPHGSRSGNEREWIDYTLGMYYSLLNTGLKISPTAGTANGVHPVPAGFGRVYVHLPQGFSYENWCRGLREGRSFVTTGPMLIATASGHDSGYRFTLNSNSESEAIKSRTIPLQMTVVSEQPITFGELIFNGEPIQVLRPSNQPQPNGGFASQFQTEFQPDRSGWFAVRFFEDRVQGNSTPRTRFVHSAPWYVDVDQQPVKIRVAEKRYLVQRMRDEIERSREVVTGDGMAEYEQALAFYESLPELDDTDAVRRNARPLGNEQQRLGWLQNMIIDHRLTPEELRLATGLHSQTAIDFVREFSDRATSLGPDKSSDANTAIDASDSLLKVLPFPGGRHPRRGFLEGAIDPQRETKISVFSPWDEKGYVVVDVPEAVFSNLGLTYLAHTHIPTIWDEQNIRLPQLEWTKEADDFVMLRTLPNGIKIRSQVSPGKQGVTMKMSLTNGTSEPLTGLRAQVCVMLSAMPGFSTQTARRSAQLDDLIAVEGDEPGKWIIAGWTPNHRAWTNPPVPCIHSDPIFPDCPPGETSHVFGYLGFYSGDSIQEHLQQLQQELTP